MNCMKTAMSKSQIFTFTYALNLLNCRLDPYFGCRALAAEGPYFKKRIGSLFQILHHRILSGPRLSVGGEKKNSVPISASSSMVVGVSDSDSD